MNDQELVPITEGQVAAAIALAVEKGWNTDHLRIYVNALQAEVMTMNPPEVEDSIGHMLDLPVFTHRAVPVHKIYLEGPEGSLLIPLI